MNTDKSERELLADISKKLDQVIGLLAVQQSEDDENAKIKLLYGLGLKPAVISAILGLSLNAVRIRMTRVRKKTKGGKK